MPNFFIIDAGQKHGPFNDQQLKALAAKGRITPTTPLETEGGHKGLAGQVNGLKFNVSSPTPVATPRPAPPAAPPPPPPPKQLFCTNCGNSISELAVACMSCGAKPVGHRRFCRQCGVGLNPEQIVCIKCGVGLTSDSSPNSGQGGFSMPNPRSAFQAPGVLSDAEQRKKRISLLAGGCYIFATAMVLISFFNVLIGDIVGKEAARKLESQGVNFRGNVVFHHSSEAIKEQVDLAKGRVAQFAMVLIIPLTIAFYCCYFFFLLRIWEEVPKEFARTTPATAAVFSLIPLFAYYWMFVALRGLYSDMNKARKSYGHGTRFDGARVGFACVGWLGLDVYDSIVLIATMNNTTWGVQLAIFSAFWAASLIPTYWIIQKDVNKFIDIKSSVGQ